MVAAALGWTRTTHREAASLHAGSLRAHLQEIHAAAAVNVRRFEENPNAPLDELLAAAEASLAAAEELCDGVSQWVEEDQEPSLSADPDLGPTSLIYKEIDARLSRAAGAAQVADLAAVGAMMLRGRRRALREVTARTPSRWEIVDASAGAFRAVKKALGALDAALARLSTGEEASSLHLSELSRSLLVRREYFRFRRDILARAAATPHLDGAGAVCARLRSAGNILARLIGSEAYEHLRTKDRVLLRALQPRIIAHLRAAAGGAADAAEGVHLWQEIESLAELLAGVNRREELVQHDASLFASHLDDLDAIAHPAGGPAPGHVVEALRAALGRDADLDALLVSRRSPPSAGELREALRRALHRISPISRAGAAPPCGTQQRPDDFL
jgi:hypothetical protein